MVTGRELSSVMDSSMVKCPMVNCPVMTCPILKCPPSDMSARLHREIAKQRHWPSLRHKATMLWHLIWTCPTGIFHTHAFSSSVVTPNLHSLVAGACSAKSWGQVNILIWLLPVAVFFQLFFVGFVSAEIISVLFLRLGATDSQIKISSGDWCFIRGLTRISICRAQYR